MRNRIGHLGKQRFGNIFRRTDDTGDTAHNSFYKDADLTDNNVHFRNFSVDRKMPNEKTILTILGARPQFVKASVVSRAFKKRGELTEIIVHTGQHFADNMSEIFFNELEIPSPKYNLGVNSLSHAAMTGRMLEAVEEVILAENPDIVVVYGDTNSTLAGALAAKKLHKRVAHVEAGLRSFDMSMPEEINRVLTDRLSDILFCPTTAAVENLEREGFDYHPCKIIQCGDVMFDSLLYYRAKAHLSEKTISQLPPNLSEFVLCTLHREENTNDSGRLKKILSALEEIHREIPVILLVHPRTKKKLLEHSIATEIFLVEPVGYLEMIYLLEKCRLVLTDSGGLQKEAFFMSKCCLTLRDRTEWTELVEHGVNFLVGSEPEKILNTFRECLRRKFDFNFAPYGKGDAADQIAETISQFLQS
jgi:UDP-GlcNAc3NAcA epimerase